MIEYIYFIKCPSCPECHDEHFYYFDEAKARAMNFLSHKPIITQVEADYNDFNECTNSCDLGTVWSWEDMMDDVPSDNELTTFSKSETFRDPDFFNCEFDDLDSVPDNYARPTETPVKLVAESYDGDYTLDFDDREQVQKDRVFAACEAGKEVTINIGSDYVGNPLEIRFSDGSVYSDSFLRVYKTGDDSYYLGLWHYSDDGDEAEGDDYNADCSFDEIWEMITSYIADRAVDIVAESSKPIPADMTVESLVEMTEENEDAVECKVCEELFEKAKCHKDTKRGWVCNECAKLNEFYKRDPFDHHDPDYDEDEAADALAGMIDGAKDAEYNRALDSLSESSKYKNSVEFHYDALTVTIATKVIPATLEDPEDYLEGEYTDEFDFEVETSTVEEVLWDFITEEDAADVPGGLEALENDDTWKAFLDAHFDELLEKYNDKFLEYFREDAEEAAREVFQERYVDGLEAAEDTRFDEACSKQPITESAVVSEMRDGSIEIYYSDLTATVFGPKRDVDDWDEEDVTGDFTYTVDRDEVATVIWENFITPADVTSVPGGLAALEDDQEWAKFLDSHFSILLDKYDYKIREWYRDEALEAFKEKCQQEYSEGPYNPFEESLAASKTFLEEFADAETHKANLNDCPECGSVSYDMKEQYCSNCGFGL
jgi:hypothetical protein